MNLPSDYEQAHQVWLKAGERFIAVRDGQEAGDLDAVVKALDDAHKAMLKTAEKYRGPDGRYNWTKPG